MCAKLLVNSPLPNDFWFYDSYKQVKTMYKVISVALEKMGNWFGVIFKILIPLLVMYRPIKAFIFTFVLLGTINGGDSYLSSDLGVIVFGILYAIFTLLLIFLPKVASVTEFVLIGWYFVFLIITYSGAYSALFPDVTHIMNTYSKELPLVIAFLAGKIFFFVFIKVNGKEYEKKKNRKDQLVLRS